MRDAGGDPGESREHYRALSLVETGSEVETESEAEAGSEVKTESEAETGSEAEIESEADKEPYEDKDYDRKICKGY